MSKPGRPEAITEIEQAVERASHYLAAQAPLEVFVHHNTLHAFEGLPFHDAIAAAERTLGAQGYLREDQYRALYRRGRITEEDVDAALKEVALDALPSAFPSARALAKLMLLNDIGPETPAGLAWRLSEHSAATRFQSTVAESARERIKAETGPWLKSEMSRRSGTEMLEILAGKGDAEALREGVEERFGSRNPLAGIESRNETASVPIAVACLWEACRALSERVEDRPVPPMPPPTSVRDALARVTADDPNDLCHPLLISFAGAFLDRGQTHWSMPDGEHGFFHAFRRVLGAGHAVRPTWLATIGQRLRRWDARDATAEEVIAELLDELGVGRGERDEYIERTLLQLPGWGGMFHRLESAPGPVGRAKSKVRLMDFLAVRMCLDALAFADVARRLGHTGRLDRIVETCACLPSIARPSTRGDHDRAWPLFLLAQHAGLAAPELLRAGPSHVEKLIELLERFDRRAHLQVWHEAYERNYRESLLRAIHVRSEEIVESKRAQFQIVTCLDDRFESMRRHFEELSSDHATFSAPGFFNLAIAYQGIDDTSTFPLCPVVLTPQHRIEEEPVSEHDRAAHARRRRLQSITTATATFEKASRSLIWGTVVTAFTGLLAALPLLASVFFPWIAGRLRRKVESWIVPTVRTRLHAERPEDAEVTGVASGFTFSEKAERVGTLLENIGLVRDFARVVLLVGHDSSSVNNPHFAAYSCGACGGRSGGPNARLFAHMANRKQVRDLLRGRGIDIPDGTLFVGAVYDTCADVVRMFDVEDVPDEFRNELDALQKQLREACRRNAHERCRRFEAAPPRASAREAHRHVEGRSFDLSQPRPELGHATNASCVVGRRRLSRGLFLDRRAFLMSYDPLLDDDGRILERILSAVIPVCAGINLEYFFSTTDNERYGAGTKGPHNVTGLFGVMNGASSDLRTGLPRQMIEIHEPVRLALVIETTREIIAQILERQPAIRGLIENAWLSLSLVHPTTNEISEYKPSGAFEPWTASDTRLPRVGRSSDWYQGRDGFLGPALIEGPSAKEAAHVG